MLTTQAQNALLKLIEEPPPSVVLLLCTTDPRKILPTITSRVLRLDFSRIDTQLVTGRLAWVLDQEGCKEYDREALQYVAQLANGGMRDALSMLDKVVAYESGITMGIVNQALGLVGFDDSFALLSALVARDGLSVTSSVDKLSNQGVDFKICVQDFRRFILNGIKFMLGADKSVIPMPPSELERFKTCSCSVIDMNKILDVVNELVARVAYDPDPYTLVSTMFLQLVGEM